MKEKKSYLLNIAPICLSIVVILLLTLSMKYPNSKILFPIISLLLGVAILSNGIKDLKKDNVKSGRFSIMISILIFIEGIFKIIKIL